MRNTIISAVSDAAVGAALVANYCDHAEHLELTEREDLSAAANTFRRLASQLADSAGLDIFEAYADRLAVIEARNVLAGTANFDGAAAARSATTWRDLQQVQAQHDRLYHPDVFGLSRYEQLRHYAFHLAKLVGALSQVAARPDDWVQFSETRLPDMLLFGIKLATVTNVTLPDERLR